MKIAVPVFRNRLSPVFDAACLMKVFSSGETQVMMEEASVEINSSFPHVRVEEMLSRHIDVIICAAISRECQAILMEEGVRVLAGFSGNVEEILAAFWENRLHEKQYRLPCWNVMPRCPCRRGKPRGCSGKEKRSCSGKKTPGKK